MDITQVVKQVLNTPGGDLLSPLLGMMGGGAAKAGLQAAPAPGSAPAPPAGAAAGSAPSGMDLSGLLDKFKDSGLGDQVGSWLGGGKNKPVTPEQVTQALGADRVEQLAKQAGVSANQEADGIAKALPQLVDKLSPQGQLPDPSSFQNALGKVFG